MQALSAKDFYTPTPYNQDTKNQIWLSQIADSHDNFCNCNHPFAHLLASIFPPGHKDRNFTINQILARDYKEKCLSGGNRRRKPWFRTYRYKKKSLTKPRRKKITLADDRHRRFTRRRRRRRTKVKTKKKTLLKTFNNRQT